MGSAARTAAGCRPAHVRWHESYPARLPAPLTLARVVGAPPGADPEVKMSHEGMPRRAAVLRRIAEVRDQFSLPDRSGPLQPSARAQVSVQGIQVGLRIVDYDQPAVAAHRSGEAHPAVGHSVDRRARRPEEVPGGVVRSRAAGPLAVPFEVGIEGHGVGGRRTQRERKRSTRRVGRALRGGVDRRRSRGRFGRAYAESANEQQAQQLQHRLDRTCCRWSAVAPDAHRSALIAHRLPREPTILSSAP
jgi:hypothetical protein